LPTEDPDEPILVGSIARAHGLAGEVVVDVWSEAPERFQAGRSVTARVPPDGATREMLIETTRPFGERLLVRFAGIGTRTAAEGLRGADLTVARRDVPPPPEGAHYRFELVGLRVRTREGKHLGTVADVFATGSNDVIVVRGGKREILLPYLEDVVLTIDPEQGEMVVEIPPGLNE
jgi:16S rRNA processing protein RimM